MMFRAYLRTFDGAVSEKTNTADARVAFTAFRTLVSRADLEGEKVAAVLTKDNQQQAFHRFDRTAGAQDYWLDRLDDLAAQLGIKVFSASHEMPTPEGIRAAREAASLTQTEAAALVHSALRTWQQWEAGDRAMHPGLWELFQIKTNRTGD